MFGLFKSHKSALRRRLEESISVHRTWFEWTIENGAPEATLVVELAYETDPTAPDFDREGIDEILKAVTEPTSAEVPLARVKIIPRMYGL